VVGEGEVVMDEGEEVVSEGNGVKRWWVRGIG
jgi:hypothetical protein